MTKYLLIFSCFMLTFSCLKQEAEPYVHNVRVKNAYFENIDSVRLGTFYIGKIEQGNISESILITKRMCDFFCITQSALKITADIDIQGLNEQIIIKLNEKGKVELENF